MLKRILIFIMTLVLIFAFCSTAFAFTYISSTSTNLYINASGKASCAATLIAYPGVDSVRISAYLMQLTGSGRVTVKHWAVTTSGYYTALASERYVARGYFYKYVTYFYAYEGDETERASKTVYDGYY